MKLAPAGVHGITVPFPVSVAPPPAARSSQHGFPTRRPREHERRRCRSRPVQQRAVYRFQPARERAPSMERSTRCKAQLGRTYPLIIGGEAITTENARLDQPRAPERGRRPRRQADGRAGETGDRAANGAFESWRKVPPRARRLLFKAAAEHAAAQARVQRAWLVYEVSKSWAEADGDTAEAIDFCEFYGREMLRLPGRSRSRRCRARTTSCVYIPLGVGRGDPAVELPAARS